MSINSKISIIITNFNYGKFITKCVNSCLLQDFKNNYEIIIVDDKSNDNSRKILKNLKKINKKIKIIFNNKNYGVAASANKGIKKSNSKYFVRVDADDYISKSFISRLFDCTKNLKNYLGIACNYYHTKNDKIVKKLNHKKNPISCAILYNKKKFLSLGGYNSLFRHREEEEIRNRNKKKYKIKYIKDYLYFYRMHNSNKTKQKKNMKIFYKKIYE